MNDYRYHYMFTTFVSLLYLEIKIPTFTQNIKKKTFFLSNQDLETFDLEDFKYNSVNMTAFRLVDLEDKNVVETLSLMEKHSPIGHSILNKTGILQVRKKKYHC